MIRKQKGSIVWLEFELLKDIPGLTHAIFLRHGGVSKGCFHSLNLIQTGGDLSSHVDENIRRVKQTLSLTELFSARQIHGHHVENVDDPLYREQNEFLNCDGLMTNRKEQALIIKHADCQAAIFYDPIHHAIAAVHAGWRGQVKNIYQKTISKMGHLYGSQPKNLLVAISPSLGPEHAEFKHYRQEFPEEFWAFQVRPNYFNLWELARHQLLNEGILTSHIQIAHIDTYAHPEDFFSYRREKAMGRSGPITGGHGTVAVLF